MTVEKRSEASPPASRGRVWAVACLAASAFGFTFVFAAAADAARVTSRNIAGVGLSWIYTAVPGEANRVVVKSFYKSFPGGREAVVLFTGSPTPSVEPEMPCSSIPVQCGGGDAARVFLGDGADVATSTRQSLRIYLFGMAGNDRLTGSLLTGGLGNDTLTGTVAQDLISGGVGNDIINTAGGGADVVKCEGGIDTVRADRVDRLTGCERVTRS